MGDNETEFDHISTEKLHEDAVELARHRWDVGFFWEILRMLPAAEAAAGRQEASETSIAQLSGLLYEAFSTETDPKVQRALRPVYIDYLREHGALPGGEAQEAPGERTDGPDRPPENRSEQ
ncbi:hypothetical protein [Nocardiopsis kunsanensis]|uniref:Uncharacterized protein n=1 Tax=Nocardiopsis kunsanensis TaxID=141693 RepID=A0A918XFX2_9ACTN|nr:hypothetical protein [Nocardiopsis kunsanensis]GHD30190.1 hypothetical protein GCM10007147_31730 [Nocardiopsis kunsanensis]